MNLSSKQKIGLVIIYTISCIAIGRYAGPEKVKIEKEIVKEETNTTVKDEKTNTNVDRDKETETVTTEKTYPDGTKEKTTKTVVKNKTTKTTNKDEKTVNTDVKKETEKETKIVEKGHDKVSLSLLAGGRMSFSGSVPIIYGAHISKPILGPFTIGAFGFTDGTLGMSLGVTF